LPSRVHRPSAAALLALLVMLLGGCAAPGAGKPNWAARPDFVAGRHAFLAGNYKAALPSLEKEAAAGNPRAEYTLGYMYFNGLGTATNRDKALEWIRKAARSGDAKAIEALSRLAAFGSQASERQNGAGKKSDARP